MSSAAFTQTRYNCPCSGRDHSSEICLDLAVLTPSKAVNILRAGRLSYSDSDLAQGAGRPLQPIGPAVVTICVFSVGLLYWFTVVFAFLPLNLAEAREFWLGRVSGWPTLFEAFVLTVLMLGWWVFIRILSVWLQPSTFCLASMVLYAANLTIIGVLGYNLHNMRTTVLNDQLYVRQQESELTKPGTYYLGRIRDLSPAACESTPAPCVLVELEHGATVLAHDPGSLNYPATEIVVTKSVLGYRTGNLRYYELNYYIEGDTEMIWRSITRYRE